MPVVVEEDTSSIVKVPFKDYCLSSLVAEHAMMNHHDRW